MDGIDGVKVEGCDLEKMVRIVREAKTQYGSVASYSTQHPHHHSISVSSQHTLVVFMGRVSCACALLGLVWAPYCWVGLLLSIDVDSACCEAAAEIALLLASISAKMVPQR